MTRWIGPLTAAGGTLFVLMVASRLMLLQASQPGQQLMRHTLVAIFSASALLGTAWVILAVLATMPIWRTTTWKFRVVFLLNALMVGALLVGYLFDSPSVRRTKESVLRDDLFTMRACINQYTVEKGKPPKALYELVQTGCFKKLPVDPITGRDDTWVVDRSEDPRAPGVVNVHSGARSISSSGIAYRDW